MRLPMLSIHDVTDRLGLSAAWELVRADAGVNAPRQCWQCVQCDDNALQWGDDATRADHYAHLAQADTIRPRSNMDAGQGLCESCHNSKTARYQIGCATALFNHGQPGGCDSTMVGDRSV